MTNIDRTNDPDWLIVDGLVGLFARKGYKAVPGDTPQDLLAVEGRYEFHPATSKWWSVDRSRHGGGALNLCRIMDEEKRAAGDGEPVVDGPPLDPA